MDPRASSRRDPRRGRRGLGAVLTLALAAILTVIPDARGMKAAAADTLFGHDVSWPQCSSAQGGYDLPMPPTDSDFMIIGLSKGLAFTENPCLASQVSYAGTHGIPAHGYAMATFPTAAQLSTYRAAGPFASSTRAGQLSNVGYAEAQYALASLKRIGWSPEVVWVDVEPRPAQPWPGATAAARVENRYVTEGLVRGLRDAGVGYGFYSYTSGWQEITDSWNVPGVPVWATAGRLDYPEEALDRCTQASFSGGAVYVSQWTDGTRDYNRTCGSYQFTKLPRNMAGLAGAQVTASSESAADGQVAAKAVDGSSLGYPVDHRMEWASAREKAGAWVEVRWPNPVTLDRVVLRDRPNPDDRVLSGTLRFSDGSAIAVGSLPNDGAALNVSFGARTVTSVRFTVGSAAATTWAVGLAEFEAWGKEAAAQAASNVAPGAAVSVSSENAATGQQGVKAVDGSAAGYPADATREWATTGGGAGSWIALKWPKPVTVDRVVLFDRPNANDQVLSGTLAFSDGTSVPVGQLANDGAATTVTFPARSVTSLRFTVGSVSGSTANVGLAELQAWSPPNLASFAAVSVSSQNAATGQTGAKAVDGTASGYPADATKEWATVGGGAGSWIELTWSAPVALTTVVLFDRPNASDRVTAGTLTFSDGTSVAVGALANDGAASSVSFPRREVTTMRFTIDAVAPTTANIGLAELQAY